ncbi:dehydrogenase [Terrimicrobium sacchariphilum]|uniref:Dehydrogenase n=1 Tax=Terrimicrobium sacchariphilum TaxID=690879 RepID=A0A146G895_TERSA|nr:FAD-dependent monooxygenase [Terrimicrobium sacchariphilum]GAT33925.1 dehydrogenase [Terrimicrobium sacchariphilum]
MKTVTIVGGGLSGLSLGIALRKHGVPVDLYEAGGYPRHRVCGEFISGVSDETLAELGIKDALKDAERLETHAWYRGETCLHRGMLPVPARGISRYILDDRLQRSLTGSGGQVFTHSRLTGDEREGHVWCSGRIPRQGDWIGLKGHFSGLPIQSDLEMHIASNGYVGLARIDSETVNICGLFRLRRDISGPDILERYIEEGGLLRLRQRMSRATSRAETRSAIAGFRLGWQAGPSGRLSLGDARAMIPPFTGNGMSMALESAAITAPHLAAYARGHSDWESAASRASRAMKARFSSRMNFARMLHPFLTSAPGRAFFSTASRLLPYGAIFHLLR